MPVLADPVLFGNVVSCFCDVPQIHEADAIAGVDGSGFLLASTISFKASKPLLTARKPGKLPGSLVSSAYELECGDNEISMQINLMHQFEIFAVVDDLLAAGGTVNAVVGIVESLGKSVTGVCVLVELLGLGGSDRFAVAVSSAVKY